MISLNYSALIHSSMPCAGLCSLCVRSLTWRTACASGTLSSPTEADSNFFSMSAWLSYSKSGRKFSRVTSPCAWRTYRRRLSALPMYKIYLIKRMKSKNYTRNSFYNNRNLKKHRMRQQLQKMWPELLTSYAHRSDTLLI